LNSFLSLLWTDVPAHKSAPAVAPPPIKVRANSLAGVLQDASPWTAHG